MILLQISLRVWNTLNIDKNAGATMHYFRMRELNDNVII